MVDDDEDAPAEDPASPGSGWWGLFGAGVVDLVAATRALAASDDARGPRVDPAVVESMARKLGDVRVALDEAGPEICGLVGTDVVPGLDRALRDLEAQLRRTCALRGGLADTRGPDLP
ncbi:hypothetical protein CKY47_32710 [Saccharothrix yanglingensis]|uniref:Uncharacterized protein n=1 Tax=Saccharothrix yanglingensis TaxID=659496 RepID=A0ABU0X9J8_9PSEU|nr:hypothetical protein [Saccharothrix yanglingensis]